MLQRDVSTFRVDLQRRATTVDLAQDVLFLEFTTGHFFRDTKISYTESTEKTQRYTEALKIGPCKRRSRFTLVGSLKNLCVSLRNPPRISV
jgi:hypothetical protein